MEIVYSFKFADGKEKSFGVTLDGETLDLIKVLDTVRVCGAIRVCDAGDYKPPEWAHLDNFKCSVCALGHEGRKASFCPVAVNLSKLAEEFGDNFSYEPVDVLVRTEARSYAKRTPLQSALSSLVGIIMATSGCPTMEPLKPMVRFHLPFATLEETTFRMVSMYLTAQYLRKQTGRDFDLDMKGFKEIYSRVGSLNKDFARRLREAAKRDASLNALVKLDCFAKLVPSRADGALFKEIERSFSYYFSRNDLTC